ncbi:hypothetical protein [Modestobacter lapidis]|nr:hypothetical protein [Modestobacter lapidis]
MNTTSGGPVTRAGDGRAVVGARPSLLHVHRFSRVGDDVFSAGSLYRCRCGVVRTGF